MVFVGYDGTFNPASVTKLVQTYLASSRVVKPGPNGGAMLCGYNTSSGSAASECVWVTKTTFGDVEFITGEFRSSTRVRAKLALEVRNAVEVRSS